MTEKNSVNKNEFLITQGDKFSPIFFICVILESSNVKLQNKKRYYQKWKKCSFLNYFKFNFSKEDENREEAKSKKKDWNFYEETSI